MPPTVDIALRLNGETFAATVEPRLLLSDFVRHVARLTGTHVGCEHGVCGACTILVNGTAVRSCLMFAVQARDSDIVTVEGLAEAPHNAGKALQAEFCDKHALQCGYCTPGFLISAYAYLRDHPDLKKMTEDDVRQALSGNLCRCTGYQNIVKAVLSAAAQIKSGESK